VSLCVFSCAASVKQLFITKIDQTRFTKSNMDQPLKKLQIMEWMMMVMVGVDDRMVEFS
jgi:hypothetical protein